PRPRLPPGEIAFTMRTIARTRVLEREGVFESVSQEFAAVARGFGARAVRRQEMVRRRARNASADDLVVAPDDRRRRRRAESRAGHDATGAERSFCRLP